MNRTYECELINETVPCHFISMEEFGFKQYPKRERYLAFLDTVGLFTLFCLFLRGKYSSYRGLQRDVPLPSWLRSFFVLGRSVFVEDAMIFLCVSMRSILGPRLVGVAYVLIFVTIANYSKPL